MRKDLNLRACSCAAARFGGAKSRADALASSMAEAGKDEVRHPVSAIIILMLKHTGLIFIIVVTCGLLFTILRWKGGWHMTFSQHVAMSRTASVYYSALFAVSLPLLYVFLVNWFAPTFELSGWFVFFVTLSVITQFLCTLVPETGGHKTIVHRILTGISGVSLLPIMAIITLAAAIPLDGRAISGACLMGMIILLMIALRNQRGYPYALLLQVGYYVLFFAPILYITYR